VIHFFSPVHQDALTAWFVFKVGISQTYFSEALPHPPFFVQLEPSPALLDSLPLWSISLPLSSFFSHKTHSCTSSLEPFLLLDSNLFIEFYLAPAVPETLRLCPYPSGSDLILALTSGHLFVIIHTLVHAFGTNGCDPRWSPWLFYDGRSPG